MLGRDPFNGYATQPLTQHPYVFGQDNPLRYADPSGGSAIYLLNGLRQVAANSASFMNSWTLAGTGGATLKFCRRTQLPDCHCRRRPTTGGCSEPTLSSTRTAVWAQLTVTGCKDTGGTGPTITASDDDDEDGAVPTPTPTAETTPSPTQTPTPAPSATPTPTATPAPAPTPRPRPPFVDNPRLIEGADPTDVEAQIPPHWTKKPSTKGGGKVYVDPDRNGEQVRIMPGEPSNPTASPDHQGPYVIISTVLPDRSDDELRQIVKQILSTFLCQGWIVLRRDRHGVATETQTVATDEAALIFRDPNEWAPPELNRWYVGFMTTDAGDRMWGEAAAARQPHDPSTA